MFKNLNISWWFWGVLALSIFAFFIKIPGLDWGFPATLHNDESNVVRSALGMRFGDFNPHHFDWPSLYFYINYFAFLAFIKLRILLQVLFSTETMQNNFAFWWGPDLPFYYISRTIAAIFFSLNIIAVYFLTKEYGLSNKFSFLSSLIFAVGFITNLFSFYGLSDTALTFFITMSGIFCIRILKDAKMSDYIFAGIFAGLATSTKYNGAIMCLLIFVAHIMHQKHFDIFNKKLFVAALTSVALFFIGTPFAALDWDTFLRTDDEHGALWQVQHMGHAYNWFYHIFQTTPENFGWLATLLGFYAIYLIFKLKNRNYYYLLISYVVMLLYIGSWGIAREHYSLPMFPFFAVLIAISIYHLTQNLNKYILYILVACVLISPLINTSTEIIKRGNIDTRISSGNWISENIPEQSTILSIEYLTGFFGGNLPVFDYNKYQIYQIGSKEKEIPELNTYYLIIVDNKISGDYKYSESDVIYESNNKWETGPKVKIYKILN
jgi:hypothetical protein